ncbi:MAG TPA: tRNA-uridine aminocarboxypropyltransferase [Polyangia bacterium]
MRRRNRTHHSWALRCPRCRLHTDLCACALLTPMTVRTQVVLVSHVVEHRKPTNTGHLAVACLENARLVRRGQYDRTAAAIVFDGATDPILLFPSRDAVPLDQWQAARGPTARPVTLVVPDGTWRQAKRVRARVPGLAQIPCVKLPDSLFSTYRLRHARAVGQLATLEAIAHALHILESPEVGARLLQIFRVVVDRALWSNGRLTDEEVTGGLPRGASQQGPRPPP